MRIIIVEDEGIMALFLEETLTELGHEVVASFSSASSFFEYLELNTDVDLVLMDILIKGNVDGIQAGEYLKSKHDDISLIFVTSYKDSETIQLSKKANPDGYIIKPISKNDLEASLMIIDSKVENKSKLTKDSLNNLIKISIYTYNKDNKSISFNEEPIKLTKKEKDCLSILIQNKNNYVSHSNLISNIWSESSTVTNSSLRELIYRLRKKLPKLIISSSVNIGYILKEK